MRSSSASASPDIALALTPLHLAQALCVREPSRPLLLLARQAAAWSNLLGPVEGDRWRPVEDRQTVTAAALRASGAFRLIHAVPWNRTALKLEYAALRSGGGIDLVDDGVGNYRQAPPWTWRERLKAAAHRAIDGRAYAEWPQRRAGMPGVVLHGIDPANSLLDPKPRGIDPAPLRAAWPALRRQFEHLAAHRGRPVFFDTNDVESGWYPYEAKRELLTRLLPRGPVVYFPHPFQQRRLAADLDNLIDLSGQTHEWNELACWYLQPEAVYSAFSSSVMALRWLTGGPVRHVPLHQAFFEATGHPSFSVDPNVARMLA